MRWRFTTALPFAVKDTFLPRTNPINIMHFFSPFQTLKTLTATAALALLLTLGASSVYAQSDDCDRIEGTVQVADDDADMTAMAEITPEQAGEAAVAALPEATIQDTDLEEEDGYLVYEVDLILNDQEHDAYVDAGSGEVLCMERED